MLVLDRNKTQYLGPNLLSRNTGAPFAQLRGSCCVPQLGKLGLSSDLVTMAAQFDPEPITRAALSVISTIEGFFGIGAGRREADQIVPIQNAVVANVIAPIADAVNAVYKDQLSKSQLQTMLDALLSTKSRWLDFLHNTQWSDGRAAVQAEQTLAPYFDDQENKLRALMVNAPYLGGVQNVPALTQVYIPGSTTPVNYPGVTQSGITSHAYLQTTSQYLPWILGAAVIFLLPKIGKYERG